MKAKKPLLVAVLMLALLAVALILPAAATGESHDCQVAWGSWKQHIEHAAMLPVPGTDPPELAETPWEATFSVNVYKWFGNVGGGYVLDWISPEAPPWVPPIGRHWTGDVYSVEFTKDSGVREADVVFQLNILSWGYPWPSLWHRFVLTDNPGWATDHVAVYSQFWEPGDPPEGRVDWQGLIWEDDIRGVFVHIR